MRCVLLAYVWRLAYANPVPILTRSLFVYLHVRQPVLARGARALVARGLSRVRMGSCCDDDSSGFKVISIALHGRDAAWGRFVCRKFRILLRLRLCISLTAQQLQFSTPSTERSSRAGGLSLQPYTSLTLFHPCSPVAWCLCRDPWNIST